MRIFFAAAVVLASCASQRSSYGSIAIKSGVDAAARPATFSVGKGHVAGNNLDVVADDGCIRGFVGRTPLQFCQEQSQGDEQHWAGSSGDFKVRVEGNRVSVD